MLSITSYLTAGRRKGHCGAIENELLVLIWVFLFFGWFFWKFGTTLVHSKYLCTHNTKLLVLANGFCFVVLHYFCCLFFLNTILEHWSVSLVASVKALRRRNFRLSDKVRGIRRTP